MLQKIISINKESKTMDILSKFIQEIENHTGKPFDIKNRRDFGYLNNKINRIIEDNGRKMKLIQEVLTTEEKPNQLFNNKTHYIVKKR